MWGFVAREPKGGEDKRHSLVDKLIKDREGRVYIAAWPNIPLGIWIVAEIIAKFLKDTPHKVILIIGMVALIVWALLEIFKGQNYFRRALGLLVLIGTVLSLHGLLK